jgi:hypothetical protein
MAIALIADLLLGNLTIFFNSEVSVASNDVLTESRNFLIWIDWGELQTISLENS